MMFHRICFVVLATLIALVPQSHADIKLPAIFSDNMVLLAARAVPIWGRSAPGEKITVQLPGQSLATVADASGRWRLTCDLSSRPASPFDITISGDQSKSNRTIRNAAAGEVFLASGQSNMEKPVGPMPGQKPCDNWEQEVASSANSAIRVFTVAKKVSDKPLDDCSGAWEPASPQTTAKFTAIGYFFARQIHNELHVPVGIIHSSWGGTRAESWMSPAGFTTDPALAPLATEETAYFANYPKLVDQYRADAPALYTKIFPALITNWRTEWKLAGGSGDFPFYYCQLANFDSKQPQPSRSPLAEVREAQRLTLSAVPNAGMAVLIDIGLPRDIHPTNKQEAARRLALLALAQSYNRQIESAGPMYQSMTVEGNAIRIKFTHAAGLVTHPTPNEKLQGFDLRAPDGTWFPADAVIDGTTVVVTSSKIPHPIAVRYAWADNPPCNLYNTAHLPASPFKTD